MFTTSSRAIYVLISFCLLTSTLNGRLHNRSTNNGSDDTSLTQSELAEVEALSHYGWGVYLSGSNTKAWEKVNDEYLAAIRNAPHSDYLIKDILRFWSIFDTESDSDQVTQYLTEIAQKNPAAVSLNLTVASAYMAQEHFDRARDLLTDVLEQVGWTEPLVIRRLVQCYLGTGEIKKGSRLLRHATSPNRFHGDLQIEQAAAIFYNTAANDSEFRISDNKRYQYQTLAFEHALRAADAFSSNEAQEINDETMNLVSILLKGGFTEQATLMLSSTRDKENRNVNTMRLLAECYESMEQFDKALEIWKELSKRFPLNPFYHTRMGLVLKLAQRYEDALLALKTADQLVGSPKIAFEIATLYYLTKQPREALKYAGRAPSNDINTYLLLAYIYKDLNRLEQSLAVLEGAQRVVHGQDSDVLIMVDYYLALANIYYTLDRKEDIIRTLERALELHPHHPDANNFLGFYLADENMDLDRAKKLILSALEASPNNSAYLDSLAWLYYRQRRFRKAARTIEQAIRLQEPEVDGVILDHAGDIYSALDDIETAIRLWNDAITRGVGNVDVIKQKIRNAENDLFD